MSTGSKAIPSTIECTFGETLAFFRSRAGMSQAELGRRVGCDHSYVSRLEVGGRNPSHLMALKMVRVLGLAPADRARFMASAGFLDSNDVPVDLLVALAESPGLQQAVRGLMAMRTEAAAGHIESMHEQGEPGDASW